MNSPTPLRFLTNSFKGRKKTLDEEISYDEAKELIENGDQPYETIHIKLPGPIPFIPVVGRSEYPKNLGLIYLDQMTKDHPTTVRHQVFEGYIDDRHYMDIRTGETTYLVDFYDFSRFSSPKTNPT